MISMAKIAKPIFVPLLSVFAISCAAYPNKRLRSTVVAVEVSADHANGNVANRVGSCQESAQISCGPFSPEEISACKKFSDKGASAQEICNGNEWSKKFRSEITAYLESRKSAHYAGEIAANSTGKKTEPTKP